MSAGRHDASASLLPTNLERQRSIMIDGHMRTAAEADGICQRKGLCRSCGETRTHERKRIGFSVKMEPLTTKDKRGEYTVYKGYCIKPLCYSLEQAKHALGEDVRPGMGHGSSKRKKKKRASHGQGESLKGESLVTAEVTVVQPDTREERSVVSNDTSNGSNSSSLPTLSPRRVEEATRSEKFTFHPPSHLRRSSDSGGSGYLLEEPRELSSSSVRHRRATCSEGSLLFSSLSSPPGGSSEFFSGSVSTGSRSVGSSRNIARTSLESIPMAPNLDEETVAVRELEGFIRAKRYREFMDALCTNEDIANVVKKAFQLLRNNVYLAHKAVGYVFASPSWVKYCITAMEKNVKDQSVQVEGVLALWTLSAIDEKYMVDMVKGNGVSAVLDTMKQHKNEEQVVETCCGALECFTHYGEVGLSVKDSTTKKAITRLVETLSPDCQEDNADVVSRGSSRYTKIWALRALYNLSLEKDETFMDTVQDALPQSEGLVAITRIVADEDEDVDLVEWAIRLFSSMTASSTMRPNSDSSCNLIEAVLAALGHFDSASFQEVACGLLSTLATTSNADDDAVTTGNTQKIAEVVVLSASSHPSVRCIQLSSIHVLSSLCSSLQNLALVAEMDLVNIAIDAMNSYRDDTELQGAACMMLAYLCANETAKAAIATTEGVDAIVTAFSKHVVDSDLADSSSESIETIRQGACTALASLATIPRVADILTRSGILEDIDLVMLKKRNPLMPPCIRAVVINMLVAKSQAIAEEEAVDFNTAVLGMKALKSVETPEEAETMMAAIHSVTCSSPHIFDYILSVNNGEGMDILLNSMEKFLESELVQQSGCAILTNLYVKIPYSGSLSQRTRLHAGSKSFDVVTHTEKEVNLLLKAMTKHMNTALVQEYACSALCNFIVGPYADVDPTDIKTPEEVVAAFSGTLKKVVDVLSIHEDSLDVVKSACRLFWVMAFLNDEMEMKRWSLHGITKIYEAMNRFKEDEELTVVGCCILLIMIQDEDCAQYIGSNDGIRLLVRCLRFQNEEIVERASELLAIIMRSVFSASNEFMIIDDSIEAVILCMDEHSQSASIQIELCSMLDSLVSLQDSFVKGIIGNNGGLNAIVNALSNHRDNEMVVECGCRALSGIVSGCSSAVIRRESQMLGDILMSCLTDHPNNEVIQHGVLGALWGICAREESFNDYITGTNGLPIIIDSMNQHIMSEDIVQSGCALLWMMSTYGDNKRKIGKVGVRAVINGMLAQINSSAVQKEALTALKNLSTHHDNKASITDLGGVEAIVQSMWVHMNSSQIFCAACSALNNVAVDSVTRRVATIEHGEMPAICFGMRRHANSSEAQKCACFLLKSYTFAESNLPILTSEDELVGLLMAAAENFPADCKDRANYVLQNIA